MKINILNERLLEAHASFFFILNCALVKIKVENLLKHIEQTFSIHSLHTSISVINKKVQLKTLFKMIKVDETDPVGGK